ncbi:MAG: 4-alpha-glucanotransferase [Prochlorothrix sp.]|nr:4-alpha-glucanotransferase [Prochlorothrix sp.]
MSLQRASGVLLHPTSLPSRHGIGDLGKSAYEFLDFLQSSGQKYWQILPLGPTGYEHSPYIMNFSTFAGNPLLISLEKLAEQDLLDPEDLAPLMPTATTQPHVVEYDRAIAHKTPPLEKAATRFFDKFPPGVHHDYEQFCRTQPWLEDFALFMALVEENPDKTWNQWDAPLARRNRPAMATKRQELQHRVNYHKFTQFVFFDQWRQLRQYANDRGIRIIGDISIYVCFNSADVWANPELFQLDPETLDPAYIAGVPPDYFSATGQLWGNPVYNWEKLEQTGFNWWFDRFRATLNYADLVRIDHFRGFEAYWRVPAGEETAINGEWVKAPGHVFFEKLGESLGHLPVLAEDLGLITPEVEELRDRFNFPGMKILQFAFGDDLTHNPHLPHNYPQNSVVYPGTHDNDTAVGWWQSLDEAGKLRVTHYLGYDRPDQVSTVHWDLIRVALASIADLAILPLQDLLGLDNSCRMNDPSINAGNWRWRYPSSHLLAEDISQKLRHLTEIYRR